MAGMEAIGGATQVTVQETKGKAVGQAVQAAVEKAGTQAVGGPADKYHGGKVTGAVGCPLPPPITFKQDPWEQARDLVEPVLSSSGAARLEAYQRFTEGLNCASTASLKEALKLLDQEEYQAMGYCRKAADWERLKVIELLRKNIEAELKTRPKSTEEKARELIDSVADKTGAEQLDAFVQFTEGLKTRSDNMLAQLRDQLIDRMAKEPDREQRLIYKLMLHTVNQEMDRRSRLPIVVPAGEAPPQPWPQPMPFQLSAEEHRMLNARLSTAGTKTQSAVKAIVDIKD